MVSGCLGVRVFDDDNRIFLILKESQRLSLASDTLCNHMPFKRDFEAYQKVYELTNDLDRLISIGTLNFCGIPPYSTGLQVFQILGQDKSKKEKKIQHGWRWLDIEFLFQLYDGELHPILQDLKFLINNRYVMATYRPYRLRCRFSDGELTIAKVRIYAVPSDAVGARYISQWRQRKPRAATIDKKFQAIWFKLIKYLDFSVESWHTKSKRLALSEFFNSGICLIPCRVHLEDVSKVESGNTSVNFHLSRWASNKEVELYSKKETKSHDSNTRLTRLYNDIKLPNLSAYENANWNSKTKYLESAQEMITRLLHQSKNGDVVIKGVRTHLYPFQLNSICKMLERESKEERVPVPNFLLLNSVGNMAPYYFDVSLNKFLLKPELCTLPRGGILAENMGLGKTLICLSLICLTIYDMSEIPSSYLLYLEGESDIIEVDSLGNSINDESRKARIKKLSKLCKDTIDSHSLSWKYYANSLPNSVLGILSKSSGSFKIPLETKSYSIESTISKKIATRQRVADKDTLFSARNYQTLLLCSSTLVIVPDNLLHQWSSEIKKHIHDSFLRKLYVSHHFKAPIENEHTSFLKELPDDPNRLIKFDVVILTNSLISKLFSGNETSESVLNKVYWKRLIIDEGHSMHSKQSRTSILCKRLHAERRWAVTGTPTSGLTRLHMNEDNQANSIQTNGVTKTSYVVKSKFNVKADLLKLGNIVCNFLKIEPFYSQPKLWMNVIAKPLMDDAFGSERSFSQLLDSVMVRHSSRDVDRDLSLPQLHHEPIFLEPSYHDKLSINLFTAVLAVNAVSSERTDIDYMFHPSNRQQLRRLITNLQRATFHWTGFNQEDVETLISICNTSLKRRDAHGQSTHTSQDLYLLKKSIDEAKRALNNPRWRSVALVHEMNYFTFGLPGEFTRAFGTGVIETKGNDGRLNEIGVFGAPQLLSIQSFFYKNRFMDMNNHQSLTAKLEEASKPFWDRYWKDSLSLNKDKIGRSQKNEHLKSHIKSEEVERAINLPKVVLDYDSKTNHHKSLHHNSNSGEDRATYSNSSFFLKNEVGLNESGRGLPDDGEDRRTTYSAIKDVQILGTASAKLSYLTSKLMENQQNKIKSLVFFEFEDSAYYLTELLDILGLNYILYATYVHPSRRASNLADFSSFDVEQNRGVCLVMDLRLAAQGLTVISATHVYFINPVWQRSIEAQAIKRAHRIGQTKDVYVETLVLKGTLEEEIYNRRLKEKNNETIDGEDQQKNKFVIDDTGMQNFILKHRFLEHSSDEEEFCPFIAKSKYGSLASDGDEQFEALEASLNMHKSLIALTRDSFYRRWQAFLFSRESVTKHGSKKDWKPHIDDSKEVFMQKFTETDKPITTPARKHSLTELSKFAELPKKKLRFSAV